MYSKCIHCLFLPVDRTQNLPRCSQCILRVLHHISERQARCTWVGGCWCSCLLSQVRGTLISDSSERSNSPAGPAAGLSAGSSDRAVGTLPSTWDSHLGQPLPSFHPKGKGPFCTATLFLPGSFWLVFNALANSYTLPSASEVSRVWVYQPALNATTFCCFHRSQAQLYAAQLNG